MLHLLAHHKRELFSTHLLIDVVEYKVLHDVGCQEILNFVFLCGFECTGEGDDQLAEEATNDALRVLLLVISIDVHHLDANQVLLVFSLLYELGIQLLFEGSQASLLGSQLSSLLPLLFFFDLLGSRILDSLLNSRSPVTLCLDGSFMCLHLMVDIGCNEDVREVTGDFDLFHELLDLGVEPGEDIALQYIHFEGVCEVAHILQVGVCAPSECTHVSFSNISSDYLPMCSDLILLPLPLERLPPLELLQLPLLHLLHPLRITQLRPRQLPEVLLLRIHHTQLLLLQNLHTRKLQGLTTQH